MAGYSAFGSIFCLGTTSTDQAVGSLTNIGGPGVSADTIDVTAHDSADAFREFVAGVLDGGEVSLEGNLVSASAGDTILTELTERTSTTCVIQYSTAVNACWKFEAIVTGFETDAPFDGKLGFTASVKVTGKPTFAATT